MAKVVFGNRCRSARPPGRKRTAYGGSTADVLGGEITREGDQKDDVCLGGHFYIAFLYEDDGVALPESDGLRAIYLELKTDDVEDMRRRIVDFGVTVLDMPDPHLYFQAPGGQVLRLVGIDEDLAHYEGTEHGERFVGRPFRRSDIPR